MICFIIKRKLSIFENYFYLGIKPATIWKKYHEEITDFAQ
jgi:hypothetical protein